MIIRDTPTRKVGVKVVTRAKARSGRAVCTSTLIITRDKLGGHISVAENVKATSANIHASTLT
ncbi:hypothetical protein ID866_10450 [Astraeus odoratus]|nr:hypothetical protein ID866_10450 [Astraeus odoratus]